MNHIDNHSRARIMGIVNVTPDSFSGDGLTELYSILRQVDSFVEAGVSILDVGGESTRPGAAEVSADEELRRVVPVVEAIVSRFPEVLVSVDTYKAAVAETSISAGAGMINDVTGLRGDAAMGGVIAAAAVPVVLMHNRAERFSVNEDGASYKAPEYGDVVAEVRESLRLSATNAESQGILRANIILDAGIGFGKSVTDNLRLISGSRELRSLGYSVLMGASRKSFIGSVLSREVEDRLMGSLACAAMGVMRGVDIVRVHDVEATVDFVTMLEALMAVDACEVSERIGGERHVG